LATAEAWLSWEMYRLQRRCAALAEARQTHDPKPLLDEAERLDQERAAMLARRGAQGGEVPWGQLCASLGLGPRDEDVMAALVAMHASSNTRQQLLATQNDSRLGELEVGFLCELLEPSRDLLSSGGWARPEAPLVKAGLLRPTPPKGRQVQSLLGCLAVSPACLADAALGRARLDPALASVAQVWSEPTAMFDVVLTHTNQAQLDAMLEGMGQRGGKSAPPTEGAWLIAVQGPAGTGKSLMARALAGVARQPLLSVDARLLAHEEDPLGMLRLAQANARLLRAALHIDGAEGLAAARPSLAPALGAWVRGGAGLRVLEVHDADALREHLALEPHASLTLEEPDSATREQLWESHVPHDARLGEDVDLRALAHTFELSGAQIARAVGWAQRRAASHGRPSLLEQRDLDQGARAQLSSRMLEFTQASRAQLSMDQLVLPSDAMEKVEEFLSACRHHKTLLSRWGFGRRLVTGRGLVALFSGEAGTGKTLTAEILAHELGLSLHIVSIPKIVSKWIGETEKNVREVFSQARAQNSMLLFDEADSLFARRVKVEHSNDHYQNMEVNNLLQEIERFDGVVILTTNLETNMDPAFARRILYRIEFPMPKAEQRAHIWEKLIPAECPKEEELDFGQLGKQFELSGGQIKNAILRAAYRSLGRGQRLGKQQLQQSAADEMASSGRLVRT
jgi:SpoVK/Ycf46/Vps4 family AAA+-type ATPase